MIEVKTNAIDRGKGCNISENGIIATTMTVCHRCKKCDGRSENRRRRIKGSDGRERYTRGGGRKYNRRKRRQRNDGNDDGRKCNNGRKCSDGRNRRKGNNGGGDTGTKESRTSSIDIIRRKGIRYRDNRREGWIDPTNSIRPLSKKRTYELRHRRDEDGSGEEKKFELRRRRSVANGVDPVDDAKFTHVEESENRSKGTIEAKGSDEREKNGIMKLQGREMSRNKLITRGSIVTTHMNEETISSNTRNEGNEFAKFIIEYTLRVDSRTEENSEEIDTDARMKAMIIGEKVVHRQLAILLVISAETEETNDDDGRNDERHISTTDERTMMRRRGTNGLGIGEEETIRRKLIVATVVFRSAITMITTTVVTRRSSAETYGKLRRTARGTHESLASHRITRP